MDYGTYSPRVKDIVIKNPVGSVMATSLRKRATGKNVTDDVYRQWIMFLKKKTLLDEYMIYTSNLVKVPVEFDSRKRLYDFCKEYSKFRVILPKSRIYVNWVELYDEFCKFVDDGKIPGVKGKKTFWKRILSKISLKK